MDHISMQNAMEYQASEVILNHVLHDIKTPLYAIGGFTTLAKTHMDDPEKLAEYLGDIETTNNYILELVNNLLDMRRIESEKLRLVNQPEDLMSIIAFVETIIRPIAREKKINFIVETDVKDSMVCCDRMRLNQVMINLLSNAIKYSQEETTVGLIFRQKGVKDEATGSYELIVKDQGIGMRKDFVSKMFEAFEREDTAENRSQKGSGLGLAIVKYIVEMMGGTIAVETERLKGTTITVDVAFPIQNHVDVIEEGEESDETLSIAGKKILLAEDNQFIQKMECAMLKKAGACVTLAKDGQMVLDLIECAKEDDYDLILMDVHMPKLDGVEAAKRIREKEGPIANIPIIAFTANASAEDIAACKAAGMNDVMTKSHKIENLIKYLAN